MLSAKIQGNCNHLYLAYPNITILDNHGMILKTKKLALVQN